MVRKVKSTFQEYFKDFHWSTLKNLGIGKTMLLWFLAISLIPLASLSYINYLYYYQGLNILSKKSLFTTSQLRVNDLNAYFDNLINYVHFIAKDSNHYQLMATMEKNLSDSKLPVKEAIHLKEIQHLTAQLNRNLQKSWKPDGFSDILLINPQGNIIFSLTDPGLVGLDLSQGDLSDTRAGQTCNQIINTGSTLFSDLEYFPPGSAQITGMIGTPILSKQGERLGILALQINTGSIDKIIQYSVGFGSTAKVYLVGLDLTLRSISDYGNSSILLSQKEDNQKTRIWQASKINKSLSGPDGKPILEEVTYYDNTKNNQVMGLYRSIESVEKLGVNWALVEEINTDEAHAVARELSTFAKISLVVTTIFVFLISFAVTKRFVTPIKSISAWAKQVAQGELVSKDIKVANDEVGEMKHTFNRLVSSLQSFADVSQSIALGDYTKKVSVRSSKDILGISMNEMVESFKGVVKQAKAIASGDYSTNVVPRSDQDTLGISLFDMTRKLRETSLEIKNQDWLKTGLNELALKTSGEKGIKELGDEVIIFLSHYLESQIGLLYVLNDTNKLQITASYACTAESQTISFGEGLIGQVAKEKKTLKFVSGSASFPKVDIGSGKTSLEHFIISPILSDGKLLGVIQFGSFLPFDDLKIYFLELSLETVAVAINTAQSREKVEELLSKTQEQAKELAMQKEELRQINEELEEQTKALKHSEENLQHQQEELRVINEELEERTKVLELQRDDIRKKNQALEFAQIEIRQKAEALEIASKYKSEFLTNMSHELRTPLNSILALSELLASNKQQGMTKDEIEFANIINSSGKDLLELINDILDLSKVEAGKLEIDVEDLYLDDVEDFVNKTFSPLTNKKEIFLSTEIDPGLPEKITTDPQRAMQIIKNLLSNAIKFTEKGGVSLRIFRPGPDIDFENPGLNLFTTIGFEVKDTGIGIPEEKARVIFEAFQQADGTVSRKFGGTGLGLTISRSLSRLLGGEIQLISKVGEGSVFTLYLPEKIPEQGGSEQILPMTISRTDEKPAGNPLLEHFQPLEKEPEPEEKPEEVLLSMSKSNKADHIFENKKILIVDDDMRNVFVLTKILEEKMVHIEVGKNGRDGIEKLHSNPDTALIIMDIMMPEMDGYEAMREIRKDKRFAKLPIIALTAKAMKGDREKCIEAGANDYLSKPVQSEKLISLLRVWLQR